MKKERIRTESQSRGDFNEEEDRKVRLEYFDKLRKDCESDARDSSPTFVSDDDTDEEIMKDHDSIIYKFFTNYITLFVYLTINQFLSKSSLKCNGKNFIILKSFFLINFSITNL